MTIAVIGATGTLGRSLMAYPNTVACPVRFVESVEYARWFDNHPNIDTVWHVARACRKSGVRRDFQTFRLEQNAMNRLLDTRAKQCRFVYASTKVVYGITDEEVTPLPAHHVAHYFSDDKIGTVNCPGWKTNQDVDTHALGEQHLVYAMTKLACERLVRQKCPDHKIVRIWDIM